MLLVSKFSTKFIAWLVETFTYTMVVKINPVQDVIRQGLYPDYYRDPVTGEIAGIPPKDWPDHLSHCVENIRQSLVCAADIR